MSSEFFFQLNRWLRRPYGKQVFREIKFEWENRVKKGIKTEEPETKQRDVVVNTVLSDMTLKLHKKITITRVLSAILYLVFRQPY